MVLVMRVLGAGDVDGFYQLRSGLGFGRRDADRDGAKGGVLANQRVDACCVSISGLEGQIGRDLIQL